MPPAEARATRVHQAAPETGGRTPSAFWLLALINLFVGAMVGLERTVVPLLAEQDFGLRAGATIGGFIVAFSVAKAVVNLFAGAAADRCGRRRVLMLGWWVSLPVAPLLMWAPTWGVVVFANVLLGAGQALTWSMTVNMMVDLVPGHKRGFAAGMNEFAGYLGLSATAFLTGLIAAEAGLRPWPFALGMAIVLLALVLARRAPETAPAPSGAASAAALLPRWTPGVGVPSVLGLATNLKDGLVWLSLPLLLAGRGFDLAQIGTVAGLYPLLWAAGQPLFGPLSDRVGRRLLVGVGTATQGAGLLLLALAPAYVAALAAAALLGVGTSMVYPVLIAAVADRVPAHARATALGVYRFFRDGGYAAGALIGGFGLLHLGPVTAWTGAAFLPLAVLAFASLQGRTHLPAREDPSEGHPGGTP
ncbi:MAG: MFS transporter [Trueperaceae bacterium]|nr:MFS transporter [Trueperaceae bacterium]